MPPVKVALDWTPNVNHAGFFVALERGYFDDRGLDVTFISPHVDDYKRTPARRLAAGEVNLAICPSESIISYACQVLQGDGNGPKLKAVAAVLARDTSAIVALPSSGIERPRDLDGRKYASYGARYEGRIVQQLIKNDGGTGDFKEDTSMQALGIMQGLKEGNADATWVFMGWEGVQAQREGVELNAFSLDEFKVPYGYTPVLAAREQAVTSPHEKIALRRFLEAADLGWQAVVDDPAGAAREATAAIARTFPNLPEPVTEELMVAATEYLAPHVLSQGEEATAARAAARSVSTSDDVGTQEEDAGPLWGVMVESRWATFLDWLSERGLLTTKRQSRQPGGPNEGSLDELRGGDGGEPVPRESVPAAALFTNALLPRRNKPDASRLGAHHSTDMRRSLN